MKQILLSIVMMSVCAGMSAQSVGEATTKDGMTVKYVQLWAGGPKFAKVNLGAELMSYVSAKAYNTKNTGWYFSWGCNVPMHCEYYAETSTTNLIGDMDPVVHYWGKNWRMPDADELYGLADATKVSSEWCDGETTQYVPGCRLQGYKVSGLGEYSEHNIFLPAAGYAVSNNMDTQGTYGWYWSSQQTSGYNAAGIVLGEQEGIVTYGAFMGYGYSIRPVLNEEESKGHALTYRVHYILDSASPFIGGSITVKSKTGSTIPSLIYVTDDAPIVVTMTPEGTNKLSTFTINGEDHSAEVTLSGTDYVWEGTLNEDMNIECSYAKADGKKFSWTTNEGGVVKASYDYMVGGQTAVRTSLINNQVLDNGTKVYCTITPDFGYSVDKILVNDVETSDVSSLSLGEDTRLDVTFKKDEVTGEERVIEGENMEIVDHSYYVTGGKTYGWWQLLVKTASAGNYALNLGTYYGYTSPIGHWTLDNMDATVDWGYTYIFDRQNKKIYMTCLDIDVTQIAPFKFRLKGDALDGDCNHYSINLVAKDYDDYVEGYEEKDPTPVVGIRSVKGSSGSKGLNGVEDGKFVKDGQMVIRHNGKNYGVTGTNLK